MVNFEFVLTIIIYMIAYAIEPLILFTTYFKILKPKFKKTIINVGCFFGYYCIILVKQWIVLFTESSSSIFLILFMLSYAFLITIFFFGGDIKKKLGTFISIHIFSIATDALVTIVYAHIGISVFEALTFGMKSSIINLIIGIAKSLVYVLLINLYKIKWKKRKLLYLVVLYLLTLSTTFFVMFSYTKDLKNCRSILFGLYSLQLALVAFIIVSLALLVRNKTAKEKAAIQRAEMSESKLALYQYTKETYEEVKSIRHDIKRHYNYLRELAHQNKVHEIESYLDELCSDLKRTEDLYVCDNLVLSVALYDKGQTAKEQNITFSKSITANTFPFTDSELNSILTNILDNAFEAVEKVTEGERKVSLVVKKINEAELMIHCENTYNKEVYNNLLFLSTGKDDKVNHGYGTKIVKSIVKRYHGTVTYWKDDINFYVRVIVPST